VPARDRPTALVQLDRDRAWLPVAASLAGDYELQDHPALRQSPRYILQISRLDEVADIWFDNAHADARLERYATAGLVHQEKSRVATVLPHPGVFGDK
jgi:hypothetical protein